MNFPNFLDCSGILFHSKPVLPNRWECNISRTMESLPLKSTSFVCSQFHCAAASACRSPGSTFLIFYLVHRRSSRYCCCVGLTSRFYLPVQNFFPSTYICFRKCLHSRSPGSKSYPTTGASGLEKMTSAYICLLQVL